MKYLALLILIFFTILSTYSQQIAIQGYVYDNDSHKALPFANIRIDNNLGTTTNSDGYFKYKLPENINYPINITISYVGYENKNKIIKNSDINTIYLNPAESVIPEVVVKADFIYNLLSKAFEKISENYPDEGFRQTGFFRQTVSKKDSIVYMGEAFMDAYKSSYKRKCGDNQIEILKFRKFSGQNNYEDSLRLIGGPFLFYNIDMVKLRARFLDPQYYQNYIYIYNHIINFNDDEHYELIFENTSQTLSGKILINRKDFAYSYFELNSYDTIIEKGYLKGPASYNIMYSKVGNKYHLNNYFYKLLFTKQKTQEKLLCKVSYAVTETNSDNASPIAFGNTLAYKDIFMDEIVDTSHNFWENYNIIENNSTISNFIRSSKNSEYKTNILLKYIKNFNFSIGIGEHLINTELYANKLQAIQTNGIVNTNTLNHDSKPVLYGYFSVGYHVSKKSEINYSYLKDRFSDNLYTRRDLSYVYRNRIKNYGKPIFINTELGVSFLKYEKNAKFQDEMPDFSNENLAYMGIKGTNLYIATGLTTFLSKSFAASLKFQLSYIADYFTIFKYEHGSSDIAYKSINNNSIDFTERLNSSVSFGINYYFSGF